jgi:hypothetical protein
VSNDEEKKIAGDKLFNLKIKYNESIEQFIDRFNMLRSKAEITNYNTVMGHLTKHMDPRLYKNFSLQILNSDSVLHCKMARFSLFTTIDLSQCFHSSKIKKEDRPLAAFTFDGVQYCFRKAPFGLLPISSSCPKSL